MKFQYLSKCRKFIMLKIRYILKFTPQPFHRHCCKLIIEMYNFRKLLKCILIYLRYVFFLLLKSSLYSCNYCKLHVLNEVDGKN